LAVRPRDAAYYRERRRRVLRLQAKYLTIGANQARWPRHGAWSRKACPALDAGL